MKIINNDKILQLGNEALMSQRKRMNFNLHDDAGDVMQRMIIVLEPGTYLRPHMHKNPEKREVFVILRGSLLVCLFDDNGEIVNHIVLDKDGENYIIEIPHSTWHSILPLAVHTAVFECKDGPYHPENDKIFAHWAPEEGSPDAVTYNKELLKRLGFIFPEFL